MFFNPTVTKKVSRHELDQRIKLVKKFIRESINKSSRFRGVDKVMFFEHFAHAAKAILNLQPKAVSVELTSPRNIFLFGHIDESKVYIEIFYNLETGLLSQAVLNIFSNEGQQLCYAGSLRHVLHELTLHFSPESSIGNAYPFRMFYDLSLPADTTPIV